MYLPAGAQFLSITSFVDEHGDTYELRQPIQVIRPGPNSFSCIRLSCLLIYADGTPERGNAGRDSHKVRRGTYIRVRADGEYYFLCCPFSVALRSAPRAELSGDSNVYLLLFYRPIHIKLICSSSLTKCLRSRVQAMMDSAAFGLCSLQIDTAPPSGSYRSPFPVRSYSWRRKLIYIFQMPATFSHRNEGRVDECHSAPSVCLWRWHRLSCRSSLHLSRHTLYTQRLHSLALYSLPCVHCFH